MKKNIEKVNPSKLPPALVDFFEILELINPLELPSGRAILEDFVYQLMKNEAVELKYYDDWQHFEYVMRAKAIDKAWEHLVKMSKIFNFECLIEEMKQPIVDQRAEHEGDWLERFTRFTETYTTLRSIAKLQTAMLTDNFEQGQEVWLISDDSGKIIQKDYIVPFFVPIQHIITKEGRLKPADELIASLYEVEINRLRICPICNHLYWAYRMNQKYCSRKCSNVFHQRKHLSDPENREQIKIKRKENYNYRKAVKEKNNGTL